MRVQLIAKKSQSLRSDRKESDLVGYELVDYQKMYILKTGNEKKFIATVSTVSNIHQRKLSAGTTFYDLESRFPRKFCACENCYRKLKTLDSLISEVDGNKYLTEGQIIDFDKRDNILHSFKKA